MLGMENRPNRRISTYSLLTVQNKGLLLKTLTAV